MRISDWSSDVCSSDLEVGRIAPVVTEAALDAEHAAQRARACRDGAGTGRADERLRRAVVGSIWVVGIENAIGFVASRARTGRSAVAGVAAIDRKHAVARKSTRMNSSQYCASSMPSSAQDKN